MAKIGMEFNLGDKVITAFGEIGYITKINKRNGAIDYKIEYCGADGKLERTMWLTRFHEHFGNYGDFYSIGDTIFGNKHIDKLQEKLYDIERARQEIEQRIALLQSLDKENGDD